ncbi:MAG TPA: hypothetical protein VFQ24_10710 [Terriglobia bacterium]|nr:hypothetical protein [Terriglobia bacterium]
MVSSQQLHKIRYRLCSRRTLPHLLTAALLWAGGVKIAPAQESHYFITYDHHMEEPGNLEIEFEPTTARPSGGNRFFSSLTEFEYGTTGWWTTEVYLEGQSTLRDSTVFSGYRVENRFHVLAGDHWINPVLYVEYERLSADKALKEVVGFDGQMDGLDPNGIARQEIEHEVETRLILSSDFKGWNVSENFIGEKNLAHAPWEFGYAVGVSRPLGLAAKPFDCTFCPENFRAGLEFYGGLGSADRFTLHDTSHYIAPVIAWSLPAGPTFSISPSFGLTGPAYGFILRLGVSYEFPGFGRAVRGLFTGRGK